MVEMKEAKVRTVVGSAGVGGRRELSGRRQGAMEERVRIAGREELSERGKRNI